MDVNKADIRVLEANVLEDTGSCQLAAVVARPADQGKAHVRSHTGDIEHDSLLPGAKGLKELLADSGRAQDVDLKAGPPALQVLLDKGAVVREMARVVDEDVGGAKGFEDGGNGRTVGDVGGVGLEGDAREFFGEGVLGLLDADLVPTQNADALDARGGKTPGDVLTNTTTGPRDKRTFVSEGAAWKRGGDRRVWFAVVGDK